jgi:hypothetical protein
MPAEHEEAYWREAFRVRDQSKDDMGQPIDSESDIVGKHHLNSLSEFALTKADLGLESDDSDSSKGSADKQLHEFYDMLSTDDDSEMESTAEKPSAAMLLLQQAGDNSDEEEAEWKPQGQSMVLPRQDPIEERKNQEASRMKAESTWEAHREETEEKDIMAGVVGLVEDEDFIIRDKDLQ